MESWVGASAVHIRLVPVLQVILNMTQLMVSGYQVIVVDIDTLFNSGKIQTLINRGSSVHSRVVRAPDMKSGGPGSKSRPDHSLELFHGRPGFNSLAALLNNLGPTGMQLAVNTSLRRHAPFRAPAAASVRPGAPNLRLTALFFERKEAVERNEKWKTGGLPFSPTPPSPSSPTLPLGLALEKS